MRQGLEEIVNTRGEVKGGPIYMESRTRETGSVTVKAYVSSILIEVDFSNNAPQRYQSFSGSSAPRRS